MRLSRASSAAVHTLTPPFPCCSNRFRIDENDRNTLTEDSRLLSRSEPNGEGNAYLYQLALSAERTSLWTASTRLRARIECEGADDTLYTVKSQYLVFPGEHYIGHANIL